MISRTFTRHKEAQTHRFDRGHSKWFEPEWHIWSCSLIVRVRMFLRRTVVGIGELPQPSTALLHNLFTIRFLLTQVVFVTKWRLQCKPYTWYIQLYECEFSHQQTFKWVVASEINWAIITRLSGDFDNNRLFLRKSHECWWRLLSLQRSVEDVACSSQMSSDLTHSARLTLLLVFLQNWKHSILTEWLFPKENNSGTIISVFMFVSA